MSLSVGSALGPYVILGPIGAGGMGEVYRARDGRLGRDVALKVIGQGTLEDADGLLRLEREARAASALNHPNLVVVHDIGEAHLAGQVNPVRYLVMELLAGDTLASVIADGPLKLRPFLDMAVQISEGLAAAHEAGILHRDLKPTNVIVSPEGRVKIIDFGLAKGLAPHGHESSAPTDESLTRPGAVVGTVGYMSPERVRGEPASAASDQFSLGCVFYEVLTGRKPFGRPSRAETFSAILRDDPTPIEEISPSVPAPVRWAVERCLAKSARARYASTRDLAVELATLREHASALTPGAHLASRFRGPGRVSALWAGAAVALAIAGLVGVSVLVRRPARPDPPLFRRLTWRQGTVESARFAPDGQTVLFSASWDGMPPAIYTKRPESPDAVPLDLPSATLLAISPTGETAIQLNRRGAPFTFNYGTLARVPLTGGRPREIAENVNEADWGTGEGLVVARDVNGKSRLEYPLGKVIYETAGHVGFPRLSPQGDLIAFSDHPLPADDRGSIAVVDLHGNKRTLSIEFASVDGLAWSPSGREVWFTAAATGIGRPLWGVTTDGKQRVIARLPGGIRLQDVTRSGRVLLTRGDRRLSVRWRGPKENLEREVSWFGASTLADLAEDGESIVFEEEGEPVGADYAICLCRMSGSPVRIGTGNAGALSPDGKWVLSRLPKPGVPIVLLPTGTGESRTIETGGLNVAALGSSWFPDGKRLLLIAREEGRGLRRLFVQNLDGGKPRAISPEGVGGAIAISPDGARVAAAGPDQRIALYPVEGGAARSVPGGIEGDVPLQWTSDGRSLYVQERPDLYVPIRVFLLDLSTGKRKLWKTLFPEDPAGVFAAGDVRVTRDGRSYAYDYARLLSDLYLVEGLN